jgi:winged helix DNA-binding protein
MTKSDIAHLRLANLHISNPTFKKPSEVVGWLGAVQAQDYLGSLWAVGLRMRNATEHAIEQAMVDRKIVRCWPMRGTLHYVLPEDVHWMLRLLTPRVISGNAGRQARQFGIDAATIKRSKELIERALAGGKNLTRPGIYKTLEAGHISTSNGRGLQILWRVALDGVICLGAREGKQQTFVLLDEWVPDTSVLERDEALARLVTRYFTGHGPATIQDFVWWSGLTITDTKAGIALAMPQLEQERIEGEAYWYGRSSHLQKDPGQSAYLLPNYDEFAVGYADRSATYDPQIRRTEKDWNITALAATLVVDGRIAGTWRRTFEKGKVTIKPRLFRKLTNAQITAVTAAARRYAQFLNVPIAPK